MEVSNNRLYGWIVLITTVVTARHDSGEIIQLAFEGKLTADQVKEACDFEQCVMLDIDYNEMKTPIDYAMYLDIYDNMINNEYKFKDNTETE